MPLPTNLHGSSESGSSRDRDFPVFTFPNELKFYADDKDSLRQIVTLYNPYDFAVKYKVFCTSPKLYSVVEAQGTVKPGFCVDIVVRHTAISPARFGQLDKFRIQLYDAYTAGSGTVLGKKVIESTLYERRSRETKTVEFEDDPTFAQFPSSVSGGQHDPSGNVQWQPRRAPSVPPNAAGSFSAPSPVIFLLAIGCISALCLPTENNTINSYVPDYLHLSINQKLVAAYILGLITMVIFRS